MSRPKDPILLPGEKLPRKIGIGKIVAVLMILAMPIATLVFLLWR